MKASDVQRLFKHWAKFPPIRILVASAIGFEIPKDGPDEKPKYITADELRLMVAVGANRLPTAG